MKYFPINLDIAGRKVVVVGGGRVAFRKVRSFAACPARITVVSPEICRELLGIEGIKFARRRYRKSDLRGASLAVSATNSEEVNRRVSRDAAELGIPVNVVDCPNLCTFTFPAVARRGKLVVAVSTEGGSPAFAAQIRRKIEKHLGMNVGRHLALLQEFRPAVLSAGLSPSERSRLLKRMAGDKVARILSRRGARVARETMRRMLDRARHNVL